MYNYYEERKGVNMEKNNSVLCELSFDELQMYEGGGFWSMVGGFIYNSFIWTPAAISYNRYINKTITM